MECPTGYWAEKRSTMGEMLEFTFMRNALLFSILASVSCGIAGTLITVNKMSSFAGSIAHASFGGLGLAYLVGVDPMIGATVFALGSSLLIGFISGSNRIGSSTALAAMWAAGMASGLVFIKLSGTYAADLMSWLFGSLLTVSRTDILLTAGLGAVTLLMVILFYRELLGISFDLEFTMLQGVPVGFVKGIFLVTAGLTTIVLMKVSGLIMVIALLTVPASIAGYFSRSLKGMMVLSGVLSMFFSLSGLYLSLKLDLPSGPVIILVSVVVYFSVLVYRKAKN